ncbi:unnamed protein product [Calicophoron daubneyi]|uniref:Borealin n=1 Tax=Calicophoron daubneyi TaxID=300641 RepID=A0AAV2TLD5_CALDB
MCMEFTQFKNLDLSNWEPKEGWTKKAFLELFKDLRQRIDFNIQKKVKAIELEIEKLGSLKAEVAALPPEFDSISYVEFIRNQDCVTINRSDVIKRSRMEWEDAIRTRTGKKPRRVLRPSTSKKNTTSTVRFQAIKEDVDEAVASTLPKSQSSRSRLGTGKRVQNTTALSSTPINPKAEVFAIPSTTRMATRTRGVVSRSKVRIFRPQDKIVSSRGSILVNPFALAESGLGYEPTASDIQMLRKLSKTVQAYLDSVKK